MTISKTYLQKDSNSLNAAEQRFDVMPCGAGLSAPKTSLNKLCYNQMRDIAKKRTNHLPSGQMEQTLRAYRDYAVMQSGREYASDKESQSAHQRHRQ